MSGDREMWEKLCWNAGREWLIEDKVWTRMWEGKKKPFKMETGDRGSVSIYSGKMIKGSLNRGFAIISARNPKTEEKEDAEIYCLVIQKADKDAVISDLVEQIKDQYHGKKLLIREPKRCIIRRLKKEGFTVVKKTALGSSTLTLEVPEGEKKKKKRVPAPVHLEPDEILSF